MLSFTHWCSICNYYTTRKYNLDRHTRTKHGKRETHEGENPFLEGEKPFLEGENPFLQGENPFLEGDIQSGVQFSCPTCYKSYSSKRTLGYHTPKCKKIHDPLQCGYCQRVFASRSGLSRHKHTCDGRVGITKNTANNNTYHPQNDNVLLQNLKNSLVYVINKDGEYECKSLYDAIDNMIHGLAHHNTS